MEKRSFRSVPARLALLALAMLGAALLSLCLGAAAVSPREILSVLSGGGKGTTAASILLYVRLPRTLGCLLAGAALAVSGAVIQTVLANPLAAPNIIGVNSGAGLGVALCCAVLPTAAAAVPFAAFLGAFAGVMLVLLISEKAGASRMTLVLAGVAMLCGVLAAKYSAFASQGFGANLRQCLFDKVQDFSFADIDRFSSASLITRMTNDVNTIQLTVMMCLRMLVRAPVQLLSALVVCLTMNARLTLVIAVVIPVMCLLLWLIMRACERLFTRFQQKIDALNDTVQENLIGIRVVKAFVRGDFERKKFKKSNDELRFLGLRGVQPAAKGKDSVRNGIQYLQDYRILIHPRCVNFLSEIGSYAWRKDKLGNTLNEPEDSNNHLMDAMRYAMEPYIRKRITNPPERRRYVPDGVTARDMQGGWDI